MIADQDRMPVVLVASGTATKAFDTYRQIEAGCRRCFPGHPFHLAFSSRAIRRRAHETAGVQLVTPQAVLEQLARSGHRQAVVQSLHLICGLEFHQMVWKAAQGPLELHLGLPLLASPDDFEAVLAWIAAVRPGQGEDGLVLVAHGTDHPAWMAYALLRAKMAARFGDKIFLGQVKGGPAPAVVAERLAAAGCRRVHLRPFMLVAGAHFMKDVAGDGPTSWKAQLGKQGLIVIPQGEGLGTHPAAVALFCRHIKAALAAPPLKLD
jgi:sirohydrochlorin cobaltochelatase